MKYYYVVREHSRDDKRWLWSIVSRRMKTDDDAEAWAEFCQSLEPNYEFFVISRMETD